MSSHLFPLEYVYAGNILIGIIFIISLQQLCISHVQTERPSVKSKLLICIFCFSTYIQNCLLIYHYSHTDDHKAVTVVRIFTAFTICFSAVATYQFVTVSIDAL